MSELDELEARARRMDSRMMVEPETLLSLIAAARELETAKRDAGRMHYLGT